MEECTAHVQSICWTDRYAGTSKKDSKKLGLEHKCLRDGIIQSRPDLNIVYVSESFQGNREVFGDDYIFLIPTAKVVANNLQIPYETMTNPIVYISLGSIISNKGFCKECIRAFGNTEFSVILNTGKVSPDSLGEIPKNIHAYSFVSQIEVLTYTDVFLTHCGMNSVNEAMSLAVPMVAMPFLNDQLTNAKRIVELGLGKRVHSFPSRGKELYETVRSVYADKSIKRNVMQLQNAIRNQITWDTVIERIENLIK